jgi:Domain of unknown function (DUF1707)/Domain of unknown function (DUF4190)
MSYAATNLRASDADREAAADRLRIAAGEGRLDSDELEERLTAAYAARYCVELTRLTADVTPPPAPTRPTFVRPAKRHVNALAVASVVAGLMWMSWFGSILAIVLGHVALGQIDRAGGRQSGRGIAVAGLVIGYVGLLTLVVTVLAVLAAA